MVRQHDDETELYCRAHPSSATGKKLSDLQPSVSLSPEQAVVGPVGAGLRCVYTYTVVGDNPKRVNRYYDENVHLQDANAEYVRVAPSRTEAKGTPPPRSAAPVGSAEMTALVISVVLCAFAVVLLVAWVLVAVARALGIDDCRSGN